MTLKNKTLVLPLLLIALASCNTPLNSQKNTAKTVVNATVSNVNKQQSENNSIVLIAQPQGSSLIDTLAKAKTLLQQNKAVEIQLSRGTYYLAEPVVLGPEFSGTAEAPFVMKPVKGHQVIFSGATLVQANWQRHNKQLMKAQIDAKNFDLLFINDQQQVRARYPNFDPEIRIFNGYATDAIAPDRVATWQDPTGGFVHALHRARWGGMHYEISGVDSQGEVTLTGGFQNNRSSGLHNMYRYVENVFEELDAPNEWFFDKKNSTLYFYPPADLNLANSKVTVSQAENLIELRGSINNPVKHIHVQGITFTQTKQTFMKTKEPLLRSDWTIYRGGAVVLEGTEHCQISHNTFTELGGNAIFVSNYNRAVNIASNEIYNIGAGAINFVGNPDAVRSPSFQYREFVELDKMDMQAGPKSSDYPANSRVYDNLIHHIGQLEKQVAGVQIQMAANITVSHNSIYHVPRAGINVGAGTWGGHIFEHNDVFDTVLETSDHGAFNSWGRDRFWHPKRDVLIDIVKSHADMYKLDVLKPIIIRNNRFQCDHGWDIDLDDGSSHYQIYNNVTLSGGIKLREGLDRRVENNIIINNSLHPHVWFENSKDIFRKNIVFGAYKPALMKIEKWGTEIDYNLFTRQKSLTASQKFNTDQHSIFGDPQFVDAESGNYQVKKDSPAYKMGFKNFAMDQFGVVSEHLKAKAQQPKVPNLTNNETSGRHGNAITLFGARFSSVTTLGEQSALGIPEISGALVQMVRKGIAENAGLQVGDVVLYAIINDKNHKIVSNTDLRDAYDKTKWQSHIKLVIVRNQKEQTVLLTY
ncbi:PDZ domain-containing protein [Paraglaciecola sp. L3A3]|uniref:PDZ domain-containing protein n=1 Tax=Paraglaciecola sp. L3A3 TaxID=2686358 RepID=UPI00131BF7C1|nr:PDZ domain-containing protein [Paraglaciecola sp. L3A3]